MYANAPEMFLQIQWHAKKQFFMYYVSIWGNLFGVVEFQLIYPNFFVIDDECLTPFPQHVKSLFLQQKEK